MSKAPKANTTRKPPVPSDSHAEVKAWIEGVMPTVQPIVASLDATIRRTIPGLQYAIKWSKAYYGLPDQGWIIELAAYHVSVNMVFHGATDFDSPPPLGSGRSRYVKVRTVAEAETPEMLAWIEEAARAPGWK